MTKNEAEERAFAVFGSRTVRQSMAPPGIPGAIQWWVHPGSHALDANGHVVCHEECIESEAARGRKESSVPAPVEIEIDLMDGVAVRTPRLLYNARAPYRMRQVYALKRLQDGTILAYNRAYGLIGRAMITAEMFEALKARAVELWVDWTGGPDRIPGEALWFDTSQK